MIAADVEQAKRELARKYASLPPRSRELVRVACERPELSLVNVAVTQGISISNLRKRMQAAYEALGVDGRVELVARLGPVLAEAYAPVRPEEDFDENEEDED